MSSQSGDGYRRGRQVEEAGPPRVGSVYRRLLLIIWSLGAVILLVVPAFGVGWTGIFAVVAVTHAFFAGLVWLDIRSLRSQGVEWGLSRHLWFSATLVVPFVTLLYCWYVARVVSRENERRGYGDGETESEGDEADASAEDESDDVAPDGDGDDDRSPDDEEARSSDGDGQETAAETTGN